MSRSPVLIVVAVLLIGLLFFLSTLPRQQPTRTIETAVRQGAGPGANAQ